MVELLEQSTIFVQLNCDSFSLLVNGTNGETCITVKVLPSSYKILNTYNYVLLMSKLMSNLTFLILHTFPQIHPGAGFVVRELQILPFMESHFLQIWTLRICKFTCSGKEKPGETSQTVEKTIVILNLADFCKMCRNSTANVTP